MQTSKNDALELVSVVVPAFNEENVLDEFHGRCAAVLEETGLRWEIVYVNDGSTDQTLTVMAGLRESCPQVSIVDLSRNFGKEIALTAGLEHARGDAVIAIDADLQDPPELIPELIARWRDGFDNVYAKRLSRSGESGFKKLTAKAFYRVIGGMSRVEIPENTGDFRLLSRRAVDSVLKLREHHRFMKGLFSWIGYPAIAVEYHRHSRAAGKTKWNYWNLWNFAVEGITSFSTAPLRLATFAGLGTAVMALVYASVVFYRTVAFGDPVAGYPSMIIIILFLGAVQLIFIGVIGEYLGRMFNETKNRPLYLVNQFSAGEPAVVKGQEPNPTATQPPVDRTPPEEREV
jgi:glycosyltransferase involved in cell wall biosynthesis